MADDDIVVSVGADTGDFDNAMALSVERFKARFYGWTAQLPGATFQQEPGGGQQGGTQTKWYRDYMDGVAKAAQAQRDFNSSVNEGGESQRRQINLMDMAQQLITRVILRFIAYEIVIRSVINAINAMKQAFDDMVASQALEAKFGIMTNQTQTLGFSFNQVRAAAEATGLSMEELTSAVVRLHEGGMSIREAEDSVAGLGFLAQIAGEKTAVLAGQLNKLKLHESSVSDWMTLIPLIGRGQESVIVMVNAYEEAIANEQIYKQGVEDTNKAQDRVNEIAERHLTLQQQEIARQNELAQRDQQAAEHKLQMQETYAERQYQLDTRQIEAANRLRDTQMNFAQRAGIDYSQQLERTGGTFLSPNRAAHQTRLPYNVAMQLAIQQQQEIQRGEQQIMQEEGLRGDQLRDLIKARIVGQDDLLAAAKRSREEEGRQRQYAEEDIQFRNRMLHISLEMQARQRQYNEADARYEIEKAQDNLQEQRRSQMWDRQDKQAAHERELLSEKKTIEDNLYAGLTDTANVMDIINKYSATFAAYMQRAAQAAKDFNAIDLSRYVAAQGEMAGEPAGTLVPGPARKELYGEAEDRANRQELITTLKGVQNAMDNINKHFQ